MPAPIAPLRIAAYTVTSAAGVGKAALHAALRDGRSALTPNDFGPTPLATWIGRVAGLETAPLPAAAGRLGVPQQPARLARPARRRLHRRRPRRARAPRRARVAVVLGTSTSSIGATEDAYRHLDGDGAFPADNRNPLVHTPHSLANFVQRGARPDGPCVTVSTACSSSAKVFASAERMLRLGLVDAAVVGGVDTLCGSVLFGFNALQLVSPEPCRPFDAERSGISIGEAAGFALLERDDGTADAAAAAARLRRVERRAPHVDAAPEGLGAERALDDALARAGIDAGAVDHINLHGTASAKNDEVEAALVARRFPATTHASSTKGVTGHTLGAAGHRRGGGDACSRSSTACGPGPSTRASSTPRAGRSCASRAQRRCASRSATRSASAATTAFSSSATRRAARERDARAAPGGTLFVDGIALLGADAARLGARARRVPRRGGAARDAGEARPRPRSSPPPSAARARHRRARARGRAAAVRESGLAAATLPSVFTSAHGDLAGQRLHVRDARERADADLADQVPQLGAQRRRRLLDDRDRLPRASTALTAFDASFGAGMLEAASQCQADARRCCWSRSTSRRPARSRR